MQWLYILLFVLLGNHIPSNRSSRLKAERIIDGEDPDSELKLKFVVAVMFRTNDTDGSVKIPCAGALIGDQFVATIAHCFYDNDGIIINKEFNVIISTTHLFQPARSTRYVQVLWVIIPKSYNPLTPDTYAEQGNLAIVKLAEVLPIVSGNWFLSKLNIARRRLGTSINYFYVAGYGWNDIEIIRDSETNAISIIRGSTDGKLRVAEVELMETEFCKSEKLHADIAPGYMCAKIKQNSNERKGICQGDSGAPLVRGRYLSGIAIHGFATCNENEMPAIYIDISLYSNFIIGVMNGIRTGARTLELKQQSETEFMFVEI